MKHSLLIACSLGFLSAALPAVADAPPGRYEITKGTVYDTRTTLTWQQEVKASVHTQSEASTYCAGLKLASGGWRLPRVSELLTLADRTRRDPAIDPTAFPGTPADRFLTSSGFAADLNFAWYVDFADGSTGGSEADVTYRARCVR